MPKSPSPERLRSARDLHYDLRTFVGFDELTRTEERFLGGKRVLVYENEFWTSKQRAGHSLHEVSYRACYKPQLPAFFIERFCESGDSVYDPFMGRGTTLLEAQLHGCRAVGNDINPLSEILIGPRLRPPTLPAIEARLAELELPEPDDWDEDLLVFFAPGTLRELYGWRRYFRERRAVGQFDRVDAWLQMVATNRLTGHSRGFFSVYTLPPNQATSLEAQRKINAKRGQSPDYRDTRALVLKKSRQLLRDVLPRKFRRSDALTLCASADDTSQIEDASVRLVVTSPPFLDTVDYVGDNWLRNWFCEVSINRDRLWQMSSLEAWSERMEAVLRELKRILEPGGVVAFEVGEIRKGTLSLEDEVARLGAAAGLLPECILLNTQDFTKTANCWGVENNRKGTNSNRIVVFSKEA